MSISVRAACYLRVSTGEQTVQQQRDALEDLCAARGWEPVWFADEGYSGKDDDRPALLKLLDACRRGRVRFVAVAATDRLTRSIRTLLRITEDLDKWRVRLVSVREQWPELEPRLRDLVLHVLAMVAEWELDHIRDRTRAGMERARRHGTRSGRPIGRPPLARGLLACGVALVRDGSSVRKAAAAVGVSERSLRRFMRQLAAQEVTDA